MRSRNDERAVPRFDQCRLSPIENTSASDRLFAAIVFQFAFENYSQPSLFEPYLFHA